MDKTEFQHFIIILFQYFSDVIERIRKHVPSTEHQIGIGIDITGPGIRTGFLKEVSTVEFCFPLHVLYETN